MKSTRAIALIGLRASGKSSVGRALAVELQLPFVDLDDEIVHAVDAEDAGSGPHRLEHAGDVLAHLGEATFRDLESRTLERVLLRADAFVLATGGGSVLRERNRTRLSQRAYVIWLDVSVPELQRRLRADTARRPPLRGSDPASETPVLARERASAYAQAADWRLETGVLPVREIALLVRAHLQSLGLAGPL